MEPRTDDMRALLTRAVGDLPPMSDTVPAALHLGRPIPGTEPGVLELLLDFAHDVEVTERVE